MSHFKAKIYSAPHANQLDLGDHTSKGRKRREQEKKEKR